MAKVSMGSRRRARAVALQVLFEMDCTKHDYQSSLDWLLEGASITEDMVDFARDLVSGVMESRGTIDETIQRFAPAWPLAQMPVVDRNILRLGILEIMSETVPPRVAINEAIELAKTFGSENSPKFVNGVLGSVYAALSNKAERS